MEPHFKEEIIWGLSKALRHLLAGLEINFFFPGAILLLGPKF